MSARLTVVLDDEELYRRLKVRAAEDGVAMKELVEAGLRNVLGDRADPAAETAPEDKAFDWARYESMMHEWEAEDEELDPDAPRPINLSDVKHQLYGYPERIRGGVWRVAEERTPYDAD
ncbi:MAG: hypothetical protein WBO97_05995 [Tepidiformaceae bacterium]